MILIVITCSVFSFFIGCQYTNWRIEVKQGKKIKDFVNGIKETEDKMARFYSEKATTKYSK